MAGKTKVVLVINLGGADSVADQAQRVTEVKFKHTVFALELAARERAARACARCTFIEFEAMRFEDRKQHGNASSESFSRSGSGHVLVTANVLLERRPSLERSVRVGRPAQSSC